MTTIAIKERISSANSVTVQRMMDSDPFLVDVDLAGKRIPNLKSKMILHAGPPIEWEDMSGTLRGAILGAILLEKWADSIKEAEELVVLKKIEFDSCHNHSSVGPMAGVISPNMPVFVIKDRLSQNYAYTNFNEGLGKALRFGAYDEEVLTKLNWMRENLFKFLKIILQKLEKEKGGIGLKSIISQALQMGDECHNRNQAGTLLFLKEIMPYIFSYLDRKQANELFSFISSNNHFFLNLVMAASKCMADQAHNIEYSTIVTAIARNGTEVGIRISGLGDQWFTDKAPIPEGLYFPGYSSKDANPDIGDSTITETVGLGGAAMAASPSIVKFVGGTIKDIQEMTDRFRRITITQNKYYIIPFAEFEGTPTGIDIRKIMQSGLTPKANTGIAHKTPGIGQIGAGIVTLPIKPFKEALMSYARTYKI